MIATYYAIYEFNQLSQTKGEIVDEGIIRDTEDTIYPQQNTGIEALPYECEAHKFKAEGYEIEVCSFSITRDFVKQQRTTGNRIL